MGDHWKIKRGQVETVVPKSSSKDCFFCPSQAPGSSCPLIGCNQEGPHDHGVSSEAPAGGEYEKKLLKALLKKREVDGLNGRNWDASEHYKAELEVVEALKLLDQLKGGA